MSKKYKILSIRLSEAEYDHVANQADDEDLSINMIIRQYVRREIKEVKKRLQSNTNAVLLSGNEL